LPDEYLSFFFSDGFLLLNEGFNRVTCAA